MQLNHNNYFSPEMMKKYMSTSQFKAFEECEEAALKDIREQKTCYTEGKYFEAFVCGTGDTFIDAHPEMLKKNGELYANYQTIHDSARAFKQVSIFNEIISKCEEQVIVTGIIGDVPFKGCVDFYDPETGNGYDTKCMRDFKKIWSDSDRMYLNWYFFRGYHYQAAIYRELIEQTFSKVGKQHLLAATKENVADLAYLQFSDEILDNALEIVEEFAPKFQKVKEGIISPTRCERCNYCKATRVITEPEIIGEFE